MGRNLGRRLGFNFAFLSESGKFGISRLNDLTTLPDDGWPGNPLGVTDNVNMIFNFVETELRGQHSSTP